MTHDNPHIQQALESLSRVGSLLAQTERVLRTADPKAIPRIELVLRALAQCNHNLAQAWNGALANVPEPKLEPAPQPEPREPSAFFREITARGSDTPEAHAQRNREAAAVARSIRVER